MAKTPRPLPSAQYLRSLLDYDPETGHLTWRWRDDVAHAVNARDAGRRAGCVAGDGSRRVRVNDVLYAEHRVIWAWLHDEFSALEIDHINGEPSDNRRSNLREASRSQNGANTRARGEWPKGVCFDKSRGLFAAKIKIDGRTKNLGRFSTPEAAAKAYAVAAVQTFGEFACLDR